MLNKLFFIFVLFLILFCSNSLKAQKLFVCESVDNDGQPVNSGDTFYVNRNGGNLDIFVRLNDDFNCYQAKFDIYKVGKDGNEVLDGEVSLDTHLDSRWFYIQHRFYDDGKFHIYCYDCNEYLLVSGNVQIIYK